MGPGHPVFYHEYAPVFTDPEEGAGRDPERVRFLPDDDPSRDAVTIAQFRRSFVQVHDDVDALFVHAQGGHARERGRLDAAHGAGQRIWATPILDPYGLANFYPYGIGGQHVDHYFHVPGIAHFKQGRTRSDHPFAFFEQAQYPATHRRRDGKNGSGIAALFLQGQERRLGDLVFGDGRPVAEEGRFQGTFGDGCRVYGALKALPRDAAACGEFFGPLASADRFFLLDPRAGDVCLGLTDQGLRRFDTGPGLRGLAGPQGRGRDARQHIPSVDPVAFIPLRPREPPGGRRRDQVALLDPGSAFFADRHAHGSHCRGPRIDEHRRRHECAD